MSVTFHRWLVRGGITFAVVWLLLFITGAGTVVYFTWNVTNQVLAEQKRETQEKWQRRRVKYMQSHKSDPDWMFKPAKVHPHPRDLPD